MAGAPNAAAERIAIIFFIVNLKVFLFRN